MGDDDVEVISVDDAFKKGDEISRKKIMMEALRDVRLKRSQEMRRGYFNTKFDKFGNARKTWIPDSREQYINSVIALDLLLTADTDEGYDNRKIEILDKADTSFKKWGWKEFKVRTIEAKNIYNTYKHLKEYTGEIIMPEPEAELYDIMPDGKKVRIDWSNNHNNYMQSLVLIYDELFSELIRLLDRLDYLEGQDFLTERSV